MEQCVIWRDEWKMEHKGKARYFRFRRRLDDQKQSPSTFRPRHAHADSKQQNHDRQTTEAGDDGGDVSCEPATQEDARHQRQPLNLLLLVVSATNP